MTSIINEVIFDRLPDIMMPNMFYKWTVTARYCAVFFNNVKTLLASDLFIIMSSKLKMFKKMF